MNENYSINEILLAVDQINKKKKKKDNIDQNKLLKKDYSSVPRKTLELIEEAEKIKINNVFFKNIIGKGFIAKNLFRINSLIIKSKYTIYAAGISNSKIKSQKELSREVNMFKKFFIKNKNKKIIYISTADATNNLKNKSKYVKNKIKIEKFIIKESKNYLILRIPQIIGESKNKNTLINYFYYCIKNRKNWAAWQC